MEILLAGKTLRRGRRVSALFWEVVGTETRAPADSAPGAAASGPSETSYATSIEIQNDHDFPADTPASSPPAQSDLETPPTPILLTTPSPALLHALIRSLGWSAQYSQLLSLVHWMAFHEPELRAHRTMKEPRNGAILMRRAVVALRVFLERSWLRGIEVGVRSLDGEFRVLSGVAARAYTVMDPPAVVNDVDPHFHPRRPRKPQDPTHLERVLRPADEGLVAKVRGLVDGVEEWGGWPGDEEVEGYCRDEKFEGVRAGVEEMMRER